ncbi:MAG: type VI secretion system-associated protein TagF [Rhizobiaceae bacterium]|nr:type VI secretion system-associated protein TagF [Rhizobiaceae bacterium]
MTTGFFGKIPATGDFIASGLPRVFVDRWDRWMSMELRARPDDGALDPRAWRFAIRAGIFGDQPCAGVWRMSRDRIGRRYPFAVVRLGAPPDAADPWYDAVAAIVQGMVEEERAQNWIAGRIAALPEPGSADSRDRIAFWLDDWEVHELAFADIHDLAENGLPAMRAARPETETL